ncbi:MAG: HAAS signaling domain-containing protein [Solirubrobacteraceae bacterium]
MTTTTMHPLAAGYLDRLERAARRLPRAERRELLEDIGAHLAEATHAGMPDAEALTVLDRLGDPEDIVEAQLPDEPYRSTQRGTHEWAAIFLLLFGGFLFFFGWVVGLFLLWSSRAWNTRDKLIGTLIVPGGLATVLPLTLLTGSVQTCSSFNGGPPHCTGGPSPLHQTLSVVLLVFLVLGPICSSVYLARRAR